MCLPYRPCQWAIACWCVLSVSLLVPRPAAGQGGAVAFTQQRPFVIGFIPVVGPNGGVGGVSIDAQGVVSRSNVDQLGLLRDARLKAQLPPSREMPQASTLRKVSLKGLSAELDRLRKTGKPITDDLQNLAGLTRVEYVLVYPDQRDIVLAGPAEAWRIDEQATAVGKTSGQPVLQLDDLLVALRAAMQQRASGGAITCSIEPTKEGLTRYTRALASHSGQPDEATVARLEAAMGPQQVLISGVAPGTHFARVLVAADFVMKRLGMNFEPAPVEGLPSYLEMLQDPAVPAPKNAMPRWWMAAHYEPLLKDEDGLAWQLRGAGVQTLAEDGVQGNKGRVIAVRHSDGSLSKKWADLMTAKYAGLAAKLPIFAELRNCMDLAVVAALLVKEDLPARSGCDLGLLLDGKQLPVAEQHAPRTIDSRASLVRKGRQTIISVSGGVEVDPWAVLERTQVESALAATRTTSASAKPDRWWWD